MIVQLYYQVPVTVVVDTDTGTVDRVIVHDEYVEATDDWPTTSDGVTQVPRFVASYASRVGESDVEWPAWEFGW